MSPVTSHLCFDRKYQSSCLRQIISALHLFESQVFRDFQCDIILTIFLFFPMDRIFRVKRAKIKNEEYNSVKKEGDFYQNNMIFSNGKICLSKKLSNFLPPTLTCSNLLDSFQRNIKAIAHKAATTILHQFVHQQCQVNHSLKP